jgi:PTS system mannose-specific IID component
LRPDTHAPQPGREAKKTEEAELSREAYRKCLLRCGMLNFLYTEQGLQGFGFLYSILPGLRDLHRDDAIFAQSCARYARRFNCHALWAPFLAGAFLCQERNFARGGAVPDLTDGLQHTLLNSLSAVGDSFFSGSLLVSLLLGLCCLSVLRLDVVLVLVALCWVLLGLAFKWFSFRLGLARGLPFLRQIWALKLADKAVYLKGVNAALLCLFLALALHFSPQSPVLRGWFMPLGALLFLGLISVRLRLPRLLLAFILFAVAELFAG